MYSDQDHRDRHAPSLISTGAIERGIRMGNRLRAEALKDMFSKVRHGLRSRH